MKKARKREIRGQTYYVCQYTGAPLTHRFFLPVGKYHRKEGCFATLPVLLRSVFEEEGEQMTERYHQVKLDCETYFNQPDIPMQQKLTEETPLTEAQLLDYLEGIDCGLAWLMVPNSDECKSKKPKKRKVKN